MPYPTPLARIEQDAEYDVVVLGAGGAGMSAALFAAIAGAKVLLVESTAQVGGSSAYSAATTWIPGTHLAPQVNRDDTLDNAARFLDNAVGARSPRRVREAMLSHGAVAVKTIEDHSHVKYRIRPFHPDYLSELDGSTLCGRALEPLPFDGRLLGEDFSLVRPPMPEFMVLKGMMVDRDDIPHMLGWNKSLKSALYVARVVGRHLLDRLRHPRGTRLLMGNALIGRLLLSLRERGVTLLTEARATALHRDGDGPVDAVSLEQNGLSRRIRVRGGVVLASGGFNRHPQRRARLLPGADAAWCPGAPGHTGAAHDLAESVGAVYGRGDGAEPLSHAFWAPVSLRNRRDGSTAVFPHFVFDRAKPGTITVDGEGRRFLNESTSYHLFGIAMQAAHRERPSVPACLITDAEGLRKYGLGMVRPKGMGLAAALADGYVTSAGSVAELARKLGPARGQPGADHRALQRLLAGRHRPRVRTRHHRVPARQRRRHLARPEPEPRPGRHAAVLRCQALPGRHRCGHRFRHRRRRACPGPFRHGDPRPVRGGQRHAVDHGRRVSGARHHPGPGPCVCVHRHAPCRGAWQRVDIA
jgi:hypothetical protein